MNTGNNGPAGQPPATGPGETAEASATEHPDAELLRLKREIADASAAGNTAATDEEAEPFLDLATKLRHQLAEIPAHTLDGIIVKFDDYVRLHEVNASSVWDEDFLRTIREGLERLKPSVDAKLFALEAEMKAAHEGLARVAAKNDAALHDPFYERITAAEEAAQATPAQTAEGIAAKLRMAAHFDAKVLLPTDDAGVELMRSAVQDAERIGGTVQVAPDAVLASLWQQRQANYDAVPPGEDIDDATSERAAKFDEQIVETPAHGPLGIAIKLRINAEAIVPGSQYITHRAVRAALADAERLAGIGGAA